MRPIMNIAMCAIVAAALAAPAPTPASPASADYYLKLGDIKGEAAGRSGAGTRIDILSWSWGATSNAKFGAIAGAHRDEGLNSADQAAAWLDARRPAARSRQRPHQGQNPVARLQGRRRLSRRDAAERRRAL